MAPRAGATMDEDTGEMKVNEETGVHASALTIGGGGE
jgi:hypothetical protein